MSEKNLNFLIFYPETLRGDSVGCLGNDTVETPHMDSLCEGGVAFTDAYVTHNVCSPSRCSMFTGWYPHTNGHRTLTYLLKPWERNIFRDLREEGYHTRVYGKNDLLSQDSIPISFDSVNDLTHNPSTESKQNILEDPWPEGHKYHNTFYYGERPGEAAKDRDWALIQSAIDFLRNDPPEPFCLYIPLSFVHPPYTVEEPYFSMYDLDEVPGPIPEKYDDKPSFMKLLNKAYNVDELREEDKRRIRTTYHGMVTRVDDLLGEMLETLEEADLGERTAVFVVSDHGDYTGDYGLVEKWWTGFQDCLMKVPFIAEIPGYPSLGPRRGLIEMLDLYDTLLSLAGIDKKHWSFGMDLTPHMIGESETFRNAVFAEGGHLRGEEQSLEPKLGGIYKAKTMLPRRHPETYLKSFMVRTDDSKYVYRPEGMNEFYDLNEDPRELDNLAGDNSIRKREDELQKEILNWLCRTSDSVPLDWDPRSFE